MTFTLWFLVAVATNGSFDVVSWHKTEQECVELATDGLECISGTVVRDTFPNILTDNNWIN